MAAVLAFALLAPAITSQSIGLQESQTWDYAHLASFSDFVREIRNDTSQESQMPLGMFAAWAWAKIWGTSEYSLRTLNFLWAALSLAALARVGKRVSAAWLPLLFAIQPFVWYSMDQGRPQMMEMAGGSLLLMGTVSAIQYGRFTGRNLAALCAGSVVLGGANILGLVPVVVVFLGITLHGLWKQLPGSRGVRVTLSITACALLALAIFYAATVIRGTHGAKLWTVTPLNLVFAAYEFLGFQGLGPGRQMIRSILKGFDSPSPLLLSIPLFLPMAASYATVFCAAAKSWLTKEFSAPRPCQSHGWIWCLSAGIVLESAAILFLVAIAVGLPFWGAHLAGTFPFWTASLGLTIAWSQQGLWRKAGRIASVCLLALLIVSSAFIRLAPQHHHDCYREAALAARSRAARGERVWWVADHSGGAYYGLSFGETTPSGGTVIFAVNVTPSEPEPDTIVISRPENFDSLGTARALLHKGQYSLRQSFTSFCIWSRLPPEKD